jgi:hypothetical protein
MPAVQTLCSFGLLLTEAGLMGCQCVFMVRGCAQTHGCIFGKARKRFPANWLLKKSQCVNKFCQETSGCFQVPRLVNLTSVGWAVKYV